ncbi:L,D-transpeptidase [Sulfurovum sp.]|uniref:L,D-transpeptidase n=1 Tax=Sulfurovum sp. TaxID=1969726 RepID=UPI0035635B48
MFKILLICMTFLTAGMTSEEVEILPQIGTETMPIAKTIFKQIKNDSEKIIDLTGKNFIVVSVRERGSDGRFYAVDSDGTVWWSGPVTSGAPEFRSPSGIFTIFQKKRYHMSTLWPDDSGVNNMDYMMKFTKSGHALHKGSVDWMSHGCIHIDPKDVPVIYNWSTYKTKVVITRHTYMPFAKEDLKKIYGKR